MADTEDRLNNIEERLHAIENRLGIEKKSTIVEPPLQSQEQPKLSSKKAPSTTPLTPVIVNPITEWLKENWIAGIGILFLIIAIGWFVSYAFTNNWLSETGRIALSLAAGVAVYGFGILLLKKAPAGGQILIILGGAIAILAVYAGHQLYNIFEPIPTILMLAIVAGMTGVIAVIKNLNGLGFVSILIAMIIPLLVQTNNEDQMLLISYVLLIDCAAFLLYVLRGWNAQYHLAWFATIIYTINTYYFDVNVLCFFIVVFYLLFFIPAASVASGISSRKLPWKGAIVLSTTALVLIFWIELFVPVGKEFFWYIAAALLSSVFGYVMCRGWESLYQKEKILTTILAAIFTITVLLFIIMATEDGFKLFSYSIPPHNRYDAKILFYLFESIASIVIALFVFRAPILASGVALYFMVPLILISLNYSEILYSPLYNLEFVVLCVLAGTLLLSAWLIHTFQSKDRSVYFQKIISSLLEIYTGIAVMSLIWSLCYNLIPGENKARGVAIVLYVLAAELLIYIGKVKQQKNIQMAGVAVIFFVIWRLLAIEAWEMPVEIRTITFMVTGLLLIGTAFFVAKAKTTNIK